MVYRSGVSSGFVSENDQLKGSRLLVVEPHFMLAIRIEFVVLPILGRLGQLGQWKYLPGTHISKVMRNTK